MFIKRFNIRNLIIALLVIGVDFMGCGALQAAPRSVPEINANPQTLNGLRFSHNNLQRLDIQNAHIKGLVFDNVQADNSRFINVTFENCKFTRVNFQSCRFENVAFKNCVIQGRGNPQDINNSTIFRYSVFKDVLFESTKLDNVMADDISGEGGYVYFRNMREVYPRGGTPDDDGQYAVLYGSDMHFRIVDSDLTKADLFIGLHSNSSFYAQNSKFSDLEMRSAYIYIENCTLRNTSMFSMNTMVITRSVLDDTDATTRKACYYAYNRYFGEGYSGPFNRKRCNIINGYDNAPVHVAHDDPAPAPLGIFCGHATVSNIHLQEPSMMNKAGNSKWGRELILNLRNVRISGGDWGYLEINGGNWENVTIEPTIRVDKTWLKNIKAFNLEYPQGEPWKHESKYGKPGEFSLDITPVAKPFAWPEAHVPTPKDIGLEWWPSEPGYRSGK